MTSTTQLLQAAEACERAATAQTPSEQMRADYEVLCHREAIQIGLMQAELARCSQSARPSECLPLRAEGDDFGRVRSRIPAKLFFHLLKQKNFGWEGLTSEEGQRDILKTNPVCRVKTVSGKTTVGYVGEKQKIESRKQKYHFAPGTLKLAT